MKIFLGDFNAKAGRDDILKPTIGNESSHEISNQNGVCHTKNLVAKCTMLPHCNIHKYAWTSPE
jgi:hypothetical protein